MPILDTKQAYEETISDSSPKKNRDFGYQEEYKFYLKYKRAGLPNADDVIGYDRSKRVKQMELDIEIEDQSME